jgi:hypothetical protein
LTPPELDGGKKIATLISIRSASTTCGKIGTLEERALERGDLPSVRHPLPACWWSMIFSENRNPPRIKSGAGIFGIMLGAEWVFQMSSLDDELKAMIRRNKLLGMWAAEKLGLVGESAEAYSNDLAVGTLDPERNDVLGKIRKDFEVAGLVQSDEEILRVMSELWLQASRQGQTRGDAVDAAVVQLARNLSS